MKKRLLTILAMASVAFGVQAAVGDDLTAQYLQNADFAADAPLQTGICTYSYDMASNNTTLFGMQPVTGWTASNPSDNGTYVKDDPACTWGARAAGVFALGKQTLADFTGNEDDANTNIFNGGSSYMVPAPEEGITEGNALGLVAVWGYQANYTQEVTFPAGCYTIEMPIFNAGGDTGVGANLFGFLADDGTKYVSQNKTWTFNTWTTETVSFILKEATKGVISVGYKAAGAGSAAMPHLYVAYVKVLQGDPAPILKAEADKLKETLAQLIDQADELGVDASAAQAVYDNEDATPEEVQAAIDAQREANEKGMTDFTDFFIQNAHFTYGQPLDNGVCTYDYDMEKNQTVYFGMQPVQDWAASNPSDNVAVPKGNDQPANARAAAVFAVGSPENIWLGGPGFTVPAAKANGQTEGNVFGFISVWTAQSNYTQSVTLPAGSYTINIPTLNGGGAGEIEKNLCGFIAEDGTEYLAETKTFPADGTWHNEMIKFHLDEDTPGQISIGYKAANAGSGAMPHLFIDEFTLKFNGLTDIDPSLISLQGAVRSGENYLYSDAPYEATIKAALEEAINAGSDLVGASSTDAEANVAAATAINALITQARESQAVYKSFLDFLEGTMTNAIAKYDGGDLSDFAGQLADDKDAYQTAYEEGAYTAEQIHEIINGFPERILTAVKDALATAATDGQAHNIDISCLFHNLDFANSTIDGWQNETKTSKFLSRVQTAEVWNENLNVFQTLDNMPAGVYELQTLGFFRVGASADNYTAFQNNELQGASYIYVGGNKKLMHNQAEYVSQEKDDNFTAEVEGGFVPNSNANAHYIFYDQSDMDAMNTVEGALAETGTLTIGVKSSDLTPNSWTVWGASNVIYKGTVGMESALLAEVQSKMEEANNLTETAALVVEADNKVNTALTLGEDCNEQSDIETLKDAIHALDDAIAYTKESKTLIDQIQKLFSIYNDYLVASIESDEPTYNALLENVAAAIDGGFESNDQITAYMQSLKDGWATFVQYPALQTASLTQPADITPAILNPSFEGVTGNTGAEYWDIRRVGGNNPSYGNGVFEVYNADTFDISQSVKGLAEGYYRVNVQGFLRCGGSQKNADAFAADTTYSAYLYANAQATPVCNQIQRGQESGIVGTGAEVTVKYNDNDEFYIPNNLEAVAAYFDLGLYDNTVDCYVGKDGVLKLGIKKEQHIADDWCPFDNFRLYYLGTTAPDAIESLHAENEANILTNAIYTIDGRQVSRLQRGLNIVKTTLRDGTTRTRKVIVK